MLRELMTIFRPGNPLTRMAEDFAEMLRLAAEMTVTAGRIYFQGDASSEERDRLYEQDIRVNRLERSIRKQVVTHLAMGARMRDIPYTLLLMTLVKDVERLGDYAKNLSEIPDLHDEPLPEDDPVVHDLQEIRQFIEKTFEQTAEVVARSDRETALALIHEGKARAALADKLLLRIAKSGHSSSLTAALTLGCRYYKRIGGHLLNLLSSVVMPLHKVDYFDQDAVGSDFDEDDVEALGEDYDDEDDD